MIDFSRFLKVAEYKDGDWHDYTTGKYRAIYRCVYAIRFGDGSMYIGSTKELRKRIHYHYTGMINGYHSLAMLKDAFAKTKSFEIYLLARCEKGAGLLEAIFISLLHPSLNIDTACRKITKFEDYIFNYRKE